MASGQRRNRGAEIPIEQVRVEAPHHQADWPRRAELVPGFSDRVAKARATGKWPGEPIRVRCAGDGYVLVSGFSRLAVAVEAGLTLAWALIEPASTELSLAEIHLRPWQIKARLSPQKLAQRLEQARRSGALPLPLQVRPAQGDEPAGYILLDGLYWYHVALELGLERVPAIVRRGSQKRGNEGQEGATTR